MSCFVYLVLIVGLLHLFLFLFRVARSCMDIFARSLAYTDSGSITLSKPTCVESQLPMAKKTELA